MSTTTDLTDGTGIVTGTYAYDVFGAIRSQTGGGSNYWQFTGQQRDADSGSYYLRARYYDPATSRFLGRDPLLGSVLSPQTQDRYAYVENNPVNRVDPRGLHDSEGAVLSRLFRSNTNIPLFRLGLGFVSLTLAAAQAGGCER